MIFNLMRKKKVEWNQLFIYFSRCKGGGKRKYVHWIHRLCSCEEKSKYWGVWKERRRGVQRGRENMKRMYAERSALWNTQNISQGSKLPIHHRLICKPSLPPSILPLYLLWCLTLHLIHSLSINKALLFIGYPLLVQPKKVLKHGCF